MNDLRYELLAWLDAGNSVFRPRDATVDAQEAFHRLVDSLRQLRQEGLVRYSDGHVSQTGSGVYLAIGPVLLTPKAKSALERDRQLGQRPQPSGVAPWRQ